MRQKAFVGVVAISHGRTAFTRASCRPRCRLRQIRRLGHGLRSSKLRRGPKNWKGGGNDEIGPQRTWWGGDPNAGGIHCFVTEVKPYNSEAFQLGWRLFANLDGKSNAIDQVATPDAAGLSADNVALQGLQRPGEPGGIAGSGVPRFASPSFGQSRGQRPPTNCAQACLPPKNRSVPSEITDPERQS